MTVLRDNDRCYVCGKANPAGLAVDFTIDHEARSIAAEFTPASVHQGYEGIVHGGILASLLDEAMAKLAFGVGHQAVTAEITIAYKAPAAPGDRLAVSARLLDETRKLILAEARITRGLVVIAEAKGKLLLVKKA